MLGERVLELPGLGEATVTRVARVRRGRAPLEDASDATARRSRLRGGARGRGRARLARSGPRHQARVRRHDGVPQRDRGAEVLAKRVGVLGVHPKAQVHEPHRRATRRPPTIGGGDAKPLETQERRAVRPARATA